MKRRNTKASFRLRSNSFSLTRNFYPLFWFRITKSPRLAFTLPLRCGLNLAQHDLALPPHLIGELRLVSYDSWIFEVSGNSLEGK